MSSRAANVAVVSQHFAVDCPATVRLVLNSYGRLQMQRQRHVGGDKNIRWHSPSLAAGAGARSVLEAAPLEEPHSSPCSDACVSAFNAFCKCTPLPFLAAALRGADFPPLQAGAAAGCFLKRASYVKLPWSSRVFAV